MRATTFLPVLLCFNAVATADVLVLKNGDRLSGSIATLDQGKLKLETSYAGSIGISWPEVEQITSEGPLVVRLAGGGILQGVLASPQPGQLAMAGKAPVPLDQVVLIGHELKEVENPGLLEEWHGAANLGYALARGNTEVTTLSVAVAPERKTEQDRMVAGFQALKSTQNGITSSDLLKGRFRYERNLRDRLFVYGAANLETDEREQLDLRTGQGGGFGIRFQPASHTQVAFFGGLTFLQEKFKDLDRDYHSEGAAGFDLETTWLAPAVFSTKTQYLPLFDQDGRYRLEWEASWTLPLFADFTFGLSMFDSYDSQPPRVTIKKNDFGLLTTLGWKF